MSNDNSNERPKKLSILDWFKTLNASKRAFFLLVLPIQIVFGFIYAFEVPLWMPSDERAHMTYINDVIQNKSLPVFKDIGHYESIQPPAYYLAAAGLCAFVPNASQASRGRYLRLFGLILFLCSSVLVYQIVSGWKGSELSKLAVCASFALSPVMLAIFSTITNDSLSFFLTLLCARQLLLICAKNVPTPASFVILGFTCGFGLLTKLTFFCMLSCCCFIVFYRFRKNSVSLLIRYLSLISLPALVLIAPWFVWNWNIYHALTAYGGPAKFLIHGPLRVTNTRDVYDVVATCLSYHVVPTQFWLDQFHAPLILRGGVIITCLLACVGAVFLSLSKTRDTETNLLLLMHPVSLVVWLLVVLTISVEPVRGFLGTYCGFCYMCVAGTLVLAGSLPLPERLKQYSCMVVPVFFVITNLYLVMAQLPYLKDFGLKPT